MEKWARFFAIAVCVALALGLLYVAKGDRVKIRLLGSNRVFVDDTLGGRKEFASFTSFKKKLEGGKSILPKPPSNKSFGRPNSISILI